MALTDLQKAQNKAAKAIKDRAHSARCKLYREAIDAAESSPEVKAARKAFDDADEASSRDTDARNQKIQALLAQIDKLKSEIVEIEKSVEAKELAEKRTEAAKAWRSVKDARILEASAKFVDLEGNAWFSAAAWNPPQEVHNAMEEARRGATVELGKPKKSGAKK